MTAICIFKGKFAPKFGTLAIILSLLCGPIAGAEVPVDACNSYVTNPSTALIELAKEVRAAKPLLPLFFPDWKRNLRLKSPYVVSLLQKMTDELSKAVELEAAHMPPRANLVISATTLRRVTSTYIAEFPEHGLTYSKLQKLGFLYTLQMDMLRRYHGLKSTTPLIPGHVLDFDEKVSPILAKDQDVETFLADDDFYFVRPGIGQVALSASFQFFYEPKDFHLAFPAFMGFNSETMLKLASRGIRALRQPLSSDFDNPKYNHLPADTYLYDMRESKRYNIDKHSGEFWDALAEQIHKSSPEDSLVIKTKFVITYLLFGFDDIEMSCRGVREWKSGLSSGAGGLSRQLVSRLRDEANLTETIYPHVLAYSTVQTALDSFLGDLNEVCAF